jgi:DNA polymerase III epsilon subunit-like protein
MVGTGPGGRDSQLARVSVVNVKGQSLYSRFIQPVDPVSDYRTRITGLTADQLTAEAGAVTFDEARGVVAAMLHKRIVVGHALRNDFKVLQLKA